MSMDNSDGSISKRSSRKFNESQSQIESSDNKIDKKGNQVVTTIAKEVIENQKNIAGNTVELKTNKVVTEEQVDSEGNPIVLKDIKEVVETESALVEGNSVGTDNMKGK